MRSALVLLSAAALSCSDADSPDDQARVEVLPPVPAYGWIGRGEEAMWFEFCPGASPCPRPRPSTQDASVPLRFSEFAATEWARQGEPAQIKVVAFNSVPAVPLYSSGPPLMHYVVTRFEPVCVDAESATPVPDSECPRFRMSAAR